MKRRIKGYVLAGVLAAAVLMSACGKSENPAAAGSTAAGGNTTAGSGQNASTSGTEAAEDTSQQDKDGSDSSTNDTDAADDIDGMDGEDDANKADGITDVAVEAGVADFSLRFLKEQDLSENVLISPVSIAFALSMTANGASGETLTQIENLMGAGIDDLNSCFAEYRKELPDQEDLKVSIANSIWINDKPTLEVKENFLNKNKQFYDAEIKKEVFSDKTKDEINDWVYKATDSQIENLLSAPPSKDTVMYLINALSFDGKWEDTYSESDVWEDEFTDVKGAKQNVQFMHGNEQNYIEVPGGYGVEKFYVGRDYSFAAILPNEGTDIKDLLGSLDGKTFTEAVTEPYYEKVITTLPKFEFSYGKSIKDDLKKLGMTTGFDGDKADFKDLAESENGNIYISDVIHKTRITVNESRTKAAAATAVIVAETCALEPEEPKVVELNRPFLFAVIENDTGMPLFMGVLNNVPE